MNIAVPDICRLMNMTADNSVKAFGLCQFYQFLFKIRDVRDGTLHPVFHMLREGKIRFTMLFPILVINLVQPQQEGITDIAQHRQPTHIRCYRIKDIAMGHQVTLPVAVQQIVFYDRDIGEPERNQFIEEIIVITTDINDLRPFLLHHFHQNFKEIGLCLFPSLAGFLKLPAINDVTVQDQTVAVNMFKEIGYFFRP